MSSQIRFIKKPTELLAVKRSKQDRKGITKLVEASYSLMDVEEKVLSAILEFAWSEKHTTPQEIQLASFLQKEAKKLRNSRIAIFNIASKVAVEGAYEDWSSFLESSSGE